MPGLCQSLFFADCDEAIQEGLQALRTIEGGSDEFDRRQAAGANQLRKLNGGQSM